MNHVDRCIVMLQQHTELRRVTVYVSPRHTVKATRQRRHDRRSRSETFIVSIGAPNYRERAWIETAVRAGLAFPVRKPQLTFWPSK